MVNLEFESPLPPIYDTINLKVDMQYKNNFHVQIDPGMFKQNDKIKAGFSNQTSSKF